MDRHRPDDADGEFGGPPLGGQKPCGQKPLPRGPPHGGQHFLSYADLEERYQKSRVTIWRWVRAGLLPAPYQTGPNSVGFKSQEIDERDAGLTRRAYAPAAEA